MALRMFSLLGLAWALLVGTAAPAFAENSKFYVAEQSTLYVQEFPGGVAMNLAEPGKAYRMHVYTDRYKKASDKALACSPVCKVNIPKDLEVAHAFASNATAWQLGSSAEGLTVKVVDASVPTMNVVLLFKNGLRADYTFSVGQAPAPQAKAQPGGVRFNTLGAGEEAEAPVTSARR